MSGEKKRCVENIWSNFSHYQCPNRASIGEYCKTHDPETVKARQAARDAIRRAKINAQNAKRDRAARIRAAEQEVIRQAKAWCKIGADDQPLLDAVRALEKEEE